MTSTASYSRQTIDANLSDLRKMIHLARQKVAEIGIALASEPDLYCVRSYSIETQPSSVNSISFYFAIDQEKVKDVLIFSIVNPNDGDYLAIDMVDRSIRFLWSLGTNGTTIMEHPTRIETSPRNVEEAIWYRVDVQRGQLESSDYRVFHFNGKSSYSVLYQIPRYDNRNYQVVLLMKTFDESEIIFFCSDMDNDNYSIHCNPLVPKKRRFKEGKVSGAVPPT